MQNLGVAEGGTVEVTSVVNLPRGVYCRLQPEAMSFLDLAAEIGPKCGFNILIEYGSVQYYLRVVELKPASVFECSVCHEKILCIHENQHRHCPACAVLCGSNETLGEHQRDEHTATCKCTLCHVFFTRAELQDHVDNRQCEHALMPVRTDHYHPLLCSLCGLAFKKKEIAQHTHMCSSRTERCDQCKTYVKITELDMHQQQCGAFATRQEPASLRPETLLTKASNQHAVECAYCLQGEFPNIAAVEYHVLHDCRIAKSFTTEPQQLIKKKQINMNLQAQKTPKNLIAKKSPDRFLLKDVCDAKVTPMLSVVCHPHGYDSVTQHNNNRVDHHFSNRRTPPPSPTVLLPARLELQAEKLRKSKLKPRQNPQLRSLPQPKLVATPKDDSGPADLCISSAGGTSHRALAAPHRSQVRARTRRRPAANLPPPGRLDKLP
ncbi:Zinc finger, C2H2 [Phytophthora cactorum]|nr:Zinc finger, C2H2 [Phytophthora cactorum]